SFLAIATLYLGTSTTYKPFAPPHRPWCRVGELPSFHFGFAELAAAIGSDAGQPVECEHGVEQTPDTTQATTTGVLTCSWCTNTPIFTRATRRDYPPMRGVEASQPSCCALALDLVIVLDPRWFDRHLLQMDSSETRLGIDTVRTRSTLNAI